MSKEKKVEGNPNNNGLFGSLRSVALVFLMSAIGFAGIYIFQILITLVIAAVIFLVAWFLQKKMIKEKTRKKAGNRDSEAAKSTEKGLLLAYIPFVFISFIFVFHLVDVDFVRRDEFKKTALNKLDKLIYLKAAYKNQIKDEINTLKTGVSDNLNAHKTSTDKTASRENLKNLLKISDDDFEKEHEELVTIAKDYESETIKKINAEYSIGAVFEETEDYYKKVKPIFQNWDRFQVQKYYADIDRMYEKVYKDAKGRMPHLAIEQSIESTDALVLNNPLKGLADLSFLSTLGALILTLILYVLILLPYFKSERKVFSLLVPPDPKDGDDVDGVF